MSARRLAIGGLALSLAITLDLPHAHAVCGPVILAGHDAEDHGFDDVYAKLFDALYANVTNGGSGILVIGAASASTPMVWILRVQRLLVVPQTLTFARGLDISTIDFSPYAIVFVASVESEVIGGLKPGENNLLVARSADLADFINNGGGLFGMTQGSLANRWQYIADVAPVATVEGSYSNIDSTLEGQALGIFDTNLDGCCFHNIFSTWPPFLDVLAVAVDSDPRLSGLPGFLGGQQTCIVPKCGDCNLDPGEECDDCNTDPNDGCSPDCRIELVPLFADAGPDRTICPGDPVRLGGAPTAIGGAPIYDYVWSPIDDLDDPLASNPLSTPTAVRTYTVTVTDSSMQMASDSATLTLIPDPVAQSEHAPQSCFGCSPIQFTDRSSGAILSWLWNFGDGDTSNEVGPTHLYRAPGLYSVSLTVTNLCGRSSTYNSSVEIVSLPTAAFSTDGPQCLGQPISMTNNSSADATRFDWDFGDGSPASAAFEPIHSYTVAGAYTVTLTAGNTCGDGTPATQSVRVLDVPVARFTSNSPRCNGPVKFKDASTGATTSWQWDFGDGSPLSAAQNPFHVYTVAGTYTVELTVSNTCGQSLEFSDQVTVDPNLDAGFNRWSVCEEPRGPGHPRPGTTDIADTARTVWELDDNAFCRATPCSFAMYVVADCGTNLKIPLHDVESGALMIYNIFERRYETLTATSTGPWTAGPATLIEWEDCSGNDPRWNQEVTTIQFSGTPSVCGVYRLEFPDQHAGFYWDLFTNCDGSATPGFTIYDNVCDALAAYDPLPELSLSDVSVSGVCPDYTVSFDVDNTGCVATDVQVRVESSQGGMNDSVLAGVEPGITRRASVDLTVSSCVPGVITVTLDPFDAVGECSELTDSSVSCNVSPGQGHVDTVDLPQPCLNPPLFCGVLDARDLDVCVDSGVLITWPEVADAGSGGSVTYEVYRDDVLIASGLTGTEYTDLTGVDGQTYRYRVQAVNGCGLSDLNFGEVTATDEVGGLPPPDLGNVLLGVKAANDVRLSWGWSLRTSSYEVLRDVEKRFLSPISVGVVADPTTLMHDQEAVPPTSGPLFFYRLRGISCLGVPGP